MLVVDCGRHDRDVHAANGVDVVRGMDITIVTTATNNEHGRALLDAFDFPFRKEGQ